MTHPDDVRVSLTYPRSPAGLTARLDIETADTDRRLVTLELSPPTFAELMASRVIITRSTAPVQQPQTVAEPAPAPWINVTLHATTSREVNLPANGQLQILETGDDGTVTHARFRRIHSTGRPGTPVDVPRAVWSYRPLAARGNGDSQ